MVVSFAIAIYFEIIYSGDLESYEKMLIGVLLTSIAWILTTFFTRPTSKETLIQFYNSIQPHDIGWKKIIKESEGMIKTDSFSKSNLSQEILLMFLGCAMIYCALFGIGYLLYHKIMLSLICFAISAITCFLMFRIWKK